jgi:hypothetical protein
MAKDATWVKESRDRSCRVSRSWVRIARLGERRGRNRFMAGIGNEPRLKGRLLMKARGIFEHRSEWLYLLLDEARKRGIEWDEFAPAAIYRGGRFHGESLADAAAANEGLLTLGKKLFSGMGRRVFEVKVHESDAYLLAVEFRYCPLVSAWRKLGASDADIADSISYPFL